MVPGIGGVSQTIEAIKNPCQCRGFECVGYLQQPFSYPGAKPSYLTEYTEVMCLCHRSHVTEIAAAPSHTLKLILSQIFQILSMRV